MKKATFLQEKRVKDYFCASDVVLTKIPERSNIPTPDFENGNVLVEIKGVKPSEGLEWLDEEDSRNQNDGRGVESNNDSTFNDIRVSLETAARQLRNYDPKHTKKHIVMIFFDENNGKIDVSAVLGKEYPPSTGAYLPSSKWLSLRYKNCIDAIAHFEKISDSAPKFVWDLSGDGRKFWKKYFPTVGT